jgi:hypothetical protein
MNRSDIGEKRRTAAASYRDKIAIGTRFDLQVEDVGSIPVIEDEEDLSEELLALDGLQRNHAVDAGFEKSEIFTSHCNRLVRG